MDHEAYRLNAVTEKESVVGLVAWWDFESFIFLEHIAVREDLRSSGIGSEILSKVKEINEQPVVLESDLPTDDDSTKRIDYIGRPRVDYIEHREESHDSVTSPNHIIIMSTSWIYIKTHLSRNIPLVAS